MEHIGQFLILLCVCFFLPKAEPMCVVCRQSAGFGGKVCEQPAF